MDFCKTIIMLRALLTQHALAPVLTLLLDHINFEEFVLAGTLDCLQDKQEGLFQPTSLTIIGVRV